MEAVVLISEALRGYEARIRYDMYGHSGEEHALELVRVDRPPADEKQRLQVGVLEFLAGSSKYETVSWDRFMDFFKFLCLAYISL